jgi:hypothetical protein
MSRYSKPYRSTGVRSGRIILATTLLLGVIASSLPLAAIAGGPTCTLACCAGRAPHAAGSCMNGSCHAFLSTHLKKTHHHQLASDKIESMCGLTQPAKGTTSASLGKIVLNVRASVVTNKDRNRSPSSIRISSPSMSKPCQPDCASISAFSLSKWERQKAAVSYAHQPRPPSIAAIATVNSKLIRKRKELCRKSAPRAPPVHTPDTTSYRS